jgi:hypothetical protein
VPSQLGAGRVVETGAGGGEVLGEMGAGAGSGESGSNSESESESAKP